MAITSKGFTGSVNQVDWAKMMEAVSSYGVVGAYNGTSLSGSRVPGSRTIAIATGALWAYGVYVSNSSSAQPTAASANASGLPRIDLVCMKIDWSAGTSTLIIKEGTPAGAPVAPAFTDNPGVLVEVPLVQARLEAGASDYAATAIAAGDRRLWMVGGVQAQGSAVAAPVAEPGLVVTKPGEGLIQMVGSDGNWVTFAPESTALPVTVASGADESTESTAFVPGNTSVGLSFVAPRNGKVYITLSGYIGQSQNLHAAIMSYAIRTGASIGLGTVFAAASSDRAIVAGRAVNTGAPALAQGSRRSLWTGLTPGQTYNVRVEFQTTSGGGCLVFRRELLVEPVR